MAAGGRGNALDIEEKQALIFFQADAVPWHHRILVHRLENAKWIWITPDWEVQMVDISDVSLRMIGRGEQVPADCMPVYLFGAPVSEVEIAAARLEARRLYEVLGPQAAASRVPAETRWLYSDPASENFGEEVPGAMVAAGADFLVRGSKALAKEAEGGEDDWEFLERVTAKDEAMWLDEKRSGPGRDPRIAAAPEGDTGVIILRDMLTRYKEKQLKGWVFKGPRAISELLRGVAGTGHELNTYGSYWVKQSGLNPKSATAIEFVSNLTALHFMVTVDLLDPFNSSSAEHIARRSLQIQKAVRKNPAAPDFAGLETYMQHCHDLGGGLQTTDFDRYVSGLQKDEAAVMKQARLIKEEVDARKSEGGSKNKNKKKDGAAEGAEA